MTAQHNEFVAALYQGGEFLAQGNVLSAREFLERASSLEPRNEKAQNLLGLTYFKLGLFERAAAVYERLVRVNPNDPTLHVNLGLVHLKTNHLNRAITEFEAATAIDSHHAKAHNYLGLALAQSGEYERAKFHFTAAGSDVMAEKMERAIDAQMQIHVEQADPPPPVAPVPPQIPPQFARTPAPVAELLAEAQPVPEFTPPGSTAPAFEMPAPAAEAPPMPTILHEDWGAQFGLATSSEINAQPQATEEEAMRFAEDEGQSFAFPPSDTQIDAPPSIGEETTAQEDVAAVYFDTTHEEDVVGAQFMDELDGETSWDPEHPDSQTLDTPLTTSELNDSEEPPLVEATVDESAESPAPHFRDTQLDVSGHWSDASSPPPQFAETETTPAVEDEYGEKEASAQNWVAAPLSSISLPARGPSGLFHRPLEGDDAHLVADPKARTTEELPSFSTPSMVATLSEAGYMPLETQAISSLNGGHGGLPAFAGGPFFVGNDNLAIDVHHELLVRMHGLVAMVGQLDVRPEKRRMRGKAIEQPFGSGEEQLHRIAGRGIVYLEVGRHHFHGLLLNDDGAYLKEDCVFAFEETVGFENGVLTGQNAFEMPLVNLKGEGQVLLRLNGHLKSMPVAVGTPTVVPLNRLVGWLGRMTPRLIGFAGQGALELTGEGHVFLGTA